MALYRVNKPRHAQAKFHVKKNDEVVVLSGTQQGKRGKVLEVLRPPSRHHRRRQLHQESLAQDRRNNPRAASWSARARCTSPR